MTEVQGLLDSTRTVVLVDWPSRDVPDSLARAGFTVVSADGPDEYNAYELVGDEVRPRPVDGLPDKADMVYTHRPIDEMPEIVEMATSLGARAVWVETGSEEAREIVEAAGLAYVSEPNIADAVRSR